MAPPPAGPVIGGVMMLTGLVMGGFAPKETREIDENTKML